jgi:DNA-directed RNA polymerase subunit L
MENIRTSLNGYRLDGEFKEVPIGFVNALRRICLADIPTVVLTNIQILENTTSMTHEMLQHRVEMLPVSALPEEAAILRDTKIELRFLAAPQEREVTSDDFVVVGPRKEILMHDRDLGTPMFFLKLKAGEALHIRATLGIQTTGASQVCISTFRNHIDSAQAETDRKLHIQNGGDPRIFDKYLIQRSYSKDPATLRANWFDFTLESIGVMPGRDILRRAADVLMGKITEWAKTPVLREENGWFRMETEGETFTVGQLIQELMYSGGLVEFVSRDVGHPLVPKLTIRFQTKTIQPEAVVEKAKAQALALCENVLKSV